MQDKTEKQVNPIKRSERGPLLIALILNVSMFLIGFIAGILAQSTGLLADSLDMLSDASVYTLSLMAIGRSQKFKYTIAGFSGIILLILGFGVMIEVLRKLIFGSSPESTTIILVACISLIVNLFVLKLLSKYRNTKEAHLRASWIFTRADVIANIGVIISGLLVAITQSRYPDLIIGAAIGIYVIKEAMEILSIAWRRKDL